MRYIAALDFEHLDNGVFLTSLARSISQQKDARSIIVHGDSEYTDRVIQTGVMREDARVRSIKDLNHRLIALFADQGISAIGINGYQRKFITLRDETLSMDNSFFESLPPQPVLIISTLVWHIAGAGAVPVSLPRMTSFLSEELNADSIFIFSTDDKDEILVHNKSEKMQWDALPEGFAETHLPREFHRFDAPVRLTTARDFHAPFKNNHSIIIE